MVFFFSYGTKQMFLRHVNNHHGNETALKVNFIVMDVLLDLYHVRCISAQ